MTSKHIKEETLYLNNSSCSSGSENSDDESPGELVVNGSTKTRSLKSNFIFNDLKGMRKGGPLSGRGAASGVQAKKENSKKECEGCHMNVLILFRSTQQTECDCDKVVLCYSCTFEIEICPVCNKSRVDDTIVVWRGDGLEKCNCEFDSCNHLVPILFKPRLFDCYKRIENHEVFCWKCTFLRPQCPADCAGTWEGYHDPLVYWRSKEISETDYTWR